MDKVLTEANWKKEGLPLRTKMEALKKRKTGVSEALRALEKADKELMKDMLSEAPVRDAEGALKELVKALKALDASDPKLQKLVKSMTDAAEAYVKKFNDGIKSLTRENLDGVPGGLKAWKELLKSERSTENDEFYEATSRDPTDGEAWIKLYEKYLANGDLNIANQETWKKLAALWGKSADDTGVREKIESQFPKELKKTRLEIRLTLQDTLNRLIARQKIQR